MVEHAAKYGVHGPVSNTLQGECENGIGLFCRCRASAALIPANRAIRQIDDALEHAVVGCWWVQSLVPALNLVRADVGIKADPVHILAFTACVHGRAVHDLAIMAESSAISAFSLGWSSTPAA